MGCPTACGSSRSRTLTIEDALRHVPAAPSDPRLDDTTALTCRRWRALETARRIHSLRESGVVIHGTLDDLTAPDDAWETEPTEVADTDLLDEALRLLAASHPDRN